VETRVRIPLGLPGSAPPVVDLRRCAVDPGFCGSLVVSVGVRAHRVRRSPPAPPRQGQASGARAQLAQGQPAGGSATEVRPARGGTARSASLCARRRISSRWAAERPSRASSPAGVSRMCTTRRSPGSSTLSTSPAAAALSTRPTTLWWRTSRCSASWPMLGGAAASWPRMAKSSWCWAGVRPTAAAWASLQCRKRRSPVRKARSC
jgi:hypothetical protein